MAYCDLLYKVNYIIGYTGDLNNKPTVYFCKESQENGQVRTKMVGTIEQILFLNGHITQFHKDNGNIGREQVFESFSYAIMNNSSGKAEETYDPREWPLNPKKDGADETSDGFKVIHQSRNAFTPLSLIDNATISTLGKAIAEFPLIKKRYGNVKDDYIKRL